MHYAEPRGGKDSKGGLTDERSNGERLLADYHLQGGGKATEGDLTDAAERGKASKRGLTAKSESRGQTCLHYAEPRGGKELKKLLIVNYEL